MKTKLKLVANSYSVTTACFECEFLKKGKDGIDRCGIKPDFDYDKYGSCHEDGKEFWVYKYVPAEWNQDVSEEDIGRILQALLSRETTYTIAAEEYNLHREVLKRAVAKYKTKHGIKDRIPDERLFNTKDVRSKVIDLYFNQSKSFSDIAEAVGRSYNSVYSIIREEKKRKTKS